MAHKDASAWYQHRMRRHGENNGIRNKISGMCGAAWRRRNKRGIRRRQRHGAQQQRHNGASASVSSRQHGRGSAVACASARHQSEKWRGGSVARAISETAARRKAAARKRSWRVAAAIEIKAYRKSSNISGIIMATPALSLQRQARYHHLIMAASAKAAASKRRRISSVSWQLA